MARTLLIMRHAKSRWDDPNVVDHDRKLTGRGKVDARRMGEALRARDLVPDAIVSSTARRAQGTARRVAKGCQFGGTLRLDAGLYSGGLSSFLEVLASLEPSVRRVLVVGHNPSMKEWVLHLTGEAVALPTAALVRVELAVDEWPQIDGSTVGELLSIMTPQELR
jgi:phosphohistidine phosphatase